jgi:hypothetical protein
MASLAAVAVPVVTGSICTLCSRSHLTTRRSSHSRIRPQRSPARMACAETPGRRPVGLVCYVALAPGVGQRRHAPQFPVEKKSSASPNARRVQPRQKCASSALCRPRHSHVELRGPRGRPASPSRCRVSSIANSTRPPGAIPPAVVASKASADFALGRASLFGIGVSGLLPGGLNSGRGGLEDGRSGLENRGTLRLNRKIPGPGVDH